MNLVSRASLSEGLAAMSVNPLRTMLSTLGVVMGIASVIGTLALADGLEKYARLQVAAQTDVQSISVASRTQEFRDGFPFPNGTYPIFALRDADELQAFLGPSVDVTMTVGGRCRRDDADSRPRSVIGRRSHRPSSSARRASSRWTPPSKT